MKKSYKILVVLLLFTIFVSIASSGISNVKAAQVDNKQRSISALSNIVGIDLPQYSVSESQIDNSLMYKDTLQRENVHTVLTASDSKIDTICSYVNGSLQQIYVCNNEGHPRLNTQATSDIAMAQSFLSNYQAQSKKPIISDFQSMLSKIDPAKNSSTISGDTMLNVTILGKDSTYQWTYISNGVEAPDKCVALRYTNGFLNYFVDNWDLYNVGSTTFNLSETDAINIAMSAAKNYSPDSSVMGTIGGLKFQVTNGMIIDKLLASPIYANASRNQDPLELYPMYNVWVSLDKFYPGYVYGFNVYIWADSKEVYYIQQRVAPSDPPSNMVATANNTQPLDNSVNTSFFTLNNPAIFLPLAIAIALATLMILHFSSRNKTPLLSIRMPKVPMPKLSVMLLCLLMSTAILISAFAEPVAATNSAGASVWGAESTGSRNPPNTGESWRKSNTEVTWQRNTASYIDGLFASNGYSSQNNQGSHNLGSGHTAILSKVSALEGYPRYAVVDFDHGVGNSFNNVFHYMFEDNVGTRLGTTYPGTPATGNAVYDNTLFGYTSGKAFFAFINTCMSADWNNAHGVLNGDQYSTYTQGTLPNGNGARSMPYAWTHRLVATNPTGNQMSSDGYHSTDNGQNCYIGFDFGSAALAQSLVSSDYPYYYWVYHFFYYALSNDYSIHTALDYASHDAFYGSPNFDGSPLFNTNGFTAVWLMYINGQWVDHDGDFQFTMPNCHMRVYGNAYLKLYQPQLTLAANNGLNPTFTINGQSYGVGTTRVISDVYSVNVNDIPGYVFDHFSYQGSNYGRPASMQIAHDGVLTAYFNPAGKYVSTSATADVAITASASYPTGTSPTISWVCADDYGAYYCYLTEVIVDGVSHNPNDYGNANSGSITFNNIQSGHSVVVHSAPYYYPVTFNQYAHDDNFGDLLVNSWTEYRVAWEERDGPVYSHGSDLHGGGPVSTYVASSITDPCGYGSDNFNYAVAHNWGGGSESYYYSIPMDIWTYTWGNTVDVYYQHAPQTYSTTVNVWVTYDGYYYYPWDTYYIYEPAGSNYLDFGYDFIQAYNYYDSSWHYSNPDWYNLGTGTTIDVGYWYGYGMSPMTPPIESGSATSGIPTGNFTPPAPNPYIYDSSTNTYIPIPYNTTVR
ncbi:MAG: hypothetical protein NWE98_09070 [Candidatus Bathyarchaeota archaeon]|nr:hypothetical protein [Candidatus Bathyarchaeota archaeon]